MTIRTIRPDLLGVTPDGVEVAIEIAYASGGYGIKVAEFQRLNLPALEIDLSRFTPDNFSPAEVKEAVIRSVAEKSWVWPTELPPVAETSPAPDMPPLPTVKKYLPEEIINFSGRWVSVKQFPSGDIAVRVVAYDPDLVSLVRSVAKAHGGR